MELTFTTQKYIKQDDVPVTLKLPDEQQFYFETGIRRSICVTPIWTTWNEENYQKPEQIYKYSVICVHRCFESKIDLFEVAVSEIPSLWQSKNDSDRKSIVELFQYYGVESNRTAERFMEDYNAVLSKINESMQC